MRGSSLRARGGTSGPSAARGPGSVPVVGAAVRGRGSPRPTSSPRDPESEVGRRGPEVGRRAQGSSPAIRPKVRRDSARGRMVVVLGRGSAVRARLAPCNRAWRARPGRWMRPIMARPWTQRAWQRNYDELRPVRAQGGTREPHSSRPVGQTAGSSRRIRPETSPRSRICPAPRLARDGIGAISCRFRSGKPSLSYPVKHRPEAEGQATPRRPGHSPPDRLLVGDPDRGEPVCVADRLAPAELGHKHAADDQQPAEQLDRA